MSLYLLSGYGLTERNCAGERRMKKQYLWGRKWSSECFVPAVHVAAEDQRILKSNQIMSVKA